MNTWLFKLSCALVGLSLTALSHAALVKVSMQTSAGEIILELDGDRAPLSVENFLEYAKSGHYNDTIFHRVIKNFMIQGGGMDENLMPKPTRAAIKNEAKNGLKNERGSIAMARTNVVNSATSQFFINLKDNAFLNHGARDYGYAVFGRVIKGMDVVDAIGNARTNSGDVPLQSIRINSVTVIE